MLASAAEVVLTLVSHFPFIWWTGPGWVHVLVSAQYVAPISCRSGRNGERWTVIIDPLVGRVEVRSTTAGRFRYARLSMQIASSPCEVARRPSLADAIILLPS
ncbi:hypothetical protein BHE74_00017019 [Ensete ventricosum]|nr:hypothetical protein GW17_00026224 [Ensete ventricosum]RWW74985.1 hypothetical protein BHE74_00017019 [Ensete ventricosum]RZR79301.1 hypothetical protein BHM03_00005007 [Ensete ventricosum]